MNKMSLKFSALSQNESFARTAVAGFLLPLSLTVSEISDVKTAVSEAVTNCVVHAYPTRLGEIELFCWYDDSEIHIIIKDYGIGIDNVKLALEPYFSTKKEEERSGIGFTVMSTFMDTVTVDSNPNQGVRVHMTKRFANRKE